MKKKKKEILIYFPCDKNRGNSMKIDNKYYVRMEEYDEGNNWHVGDKIELKHAKQYCKRCLVIPMYQAGISIKTICKALHIKEETAMNSLNGYFTDSTKFINPSWKTEYRGRPKNCTARFV